MPKLTKRTIDATEPQATEFFLWDEGIPGFGLRVMPSGRKSFVVQFRAGRRARRMSLGPSTVLTCDQARTRAITIIAAVKNGDDPAAERDDKRNAATVSGGSGGLEQAHRERGSGLAGLAPGDGDVGELVRSDPSLHEMDEVLLGSAKGGIGGSTQG